MSSDYEGEWDLILAALAEDLVRKVNPKWSFLKRRIVWVVPASYRHESDDPYETFNVVVQVSRKHVAVDWPRGADSGLWRVNPNAQSASSPQTRSQRSRIRQEIEGSFAVVAQRLSATA